MLQLLAEVGYYCYFLGGLLLGACSWGPGWHQELYWSWLCTTIGATFCNRQLSTAIASNRQHHELCPATFYLNHFHILLSRASSRTLGAYFLPKSC